jgi:dihydrofolate reductase
VTVSDQPQETLTALKARTGKDIWLFGGGSLFHSLLELGLVDAVEVAIIPVLLGGGLPLLPHPAQRTKLKLVKHRIYEKTGTVSLEYAVL